MQLIDAMKELLVGVAIEILAFFVVSHFAGAYRAYLELKLEKLSCYQFTATHCGPVKPSLSVFLLQTFFYLFNDHNSFSYFYWSINSSQAHLNLLIILCTLIDLYFVQINLQQMMNNYSAKSAAKIYMQDEDKLLNYKYSPEYRKEKARKIRIQIHNPDLLTTIKLTKKKIDTALKDRKLAQTARPAYSYNKHKWSSASLNQYQTQDKMMSTHQTKFYQTEASQLKSKESKMSRSLKEKLERKQKKRTLQQIQFQYQQKRRQQELKLQRTTSERSFIAQTWKESIEMLKKSKKISLKKQIQLCKERYLQTEKNHQFQILKNKMAKQHQKDQFEYNKSFLKNHALKESKKANPAATLKIASQTNTSLQINILPKITQRNKKKSFKTHKVPAEKKQAKLLDEKKQTPQTESINPQNQQRKAKIESIKVTKQAPVSMNSQLQKTKDQLPTKEVIGNSTQKYGNQESQLKKI